MFLRNYWYVCAWSHEIVHKILPRRILDEPIVLYRAESGRPVALADMCCHRQLPLSLGKLVGDDLQCGYHGFTYEPSGDCIRVPGQSQVPPNARVRSFPIVERWGFAWIWMGDPARADATKIPSAPWLQEPGWTAVGDLLPLACRYNLIRDNLLDLSHVSFVHQATIGTTMVAETPVTTEAGESSVRVVRAMTNIDPPPMFVRMGGFTGKVDRWQIIDWTPPANILIEAKALPTGSNDWSKGVITEVINFITPETPGSCHYFWAQARNFATENMALSKVLHADVTRTFVEDKEIVEAQEQRMRQYPDYEKIDARFDTGVLQCRRIVNGLLEAEAAGRA